MNKNRKLVKTAAVTMSAALATSVGLTSMPSMVYAADVKKDETVYVNADASGDTTNVTVSDWLQNAGSESSLKDTSILKDIQNIKGDETFTQTGTNDLVWSTDSSDIYYQGTSDEKLPVGVKFTYKLDGKTVEPSDILGKSGKLEITIDYTNTSSETIKVGDKTEKSVIPFVMITGLMLDTDKFSNVEIDHGKVVSDGNRSIVIGVGMPGLKDSLKLDDLKLDDYDVDLDIPESVTITADVTDFEMAGTLTMASSDFLKELNLDDISSVDDLQDSIDTLADSSTQLVDGTSELKDGVETLNDGVGELQDGVGQIDDGAGQLSDASNTLSAGVSTLVSGLNQLDGSKGTLVSGVDQLQSGLATLNAGAAKVDTGVNKYVNGTSTLASGVKAYIGGENDLSAGITKMANGATLLPTYLQQLEDGTKQLKAANISGSLTELKAGLTKLKTGLVGVQTYVTTINGSLEQLKTGADTTAKYAGETASELAAELTAYQDAVAQLEALNGSATPSTTQEDSNTVSDSTTSEPKVIDEQETQETHDLGSDVTENEDGTTVITNNTETIITKTITQEQTTTVTNNTTTNNTITNSKAADLSSVIADLNSTNGDLTITTAKAAGAKQAADGVAKGISDLQAGLSGNAAAEVPGLSDLVDTLVKRVDAALEGIPDDKTITGLGTNINDLATGAATLNAQGTELVGGINGLKTGVAKLDGYNTQLVGGANELLANGSDLKDGTAQIKGGTGSALAGANKLQAGAGTLSSAVGQLASGGNKLDSGAATIAEKMGELSSGTNQLASKIPDLTDGVSQLLDGATELNDGMTKFDEEGIQKITDLLGDDMTTVVDRLKAIVDLGSSYNSYSGITSDMDGSVKFIIETSSIEAE